MINISKQSWYQCSVESNSIILHGWIVHPCKHIAQQTTSKLSPMQLELNKVLKWIRNSTIYFLKSIPLTIPLAIFDNPIQFSPLVFVFISQMSTSLLNVRNSAAKKRAQKMAQSDSKKNQNQSNGMVGHTPSPPLQESGIFSMFSTLNSGMEDTLEKYPPSNNMKKKGWVNLIDWCPILQRKRLHFKCHLNTTISLSLSCFLLKNKLTWCEWAPSDNSVLQGVMQGQKWNWK